MTSQFEKILEAAIKLSNNGRLEFTIAQLVIESWNLYREEFGLLGYETKHPDSHKVMSALYGQTGLIRAGCLERSGRERNAQKWIVTTQGLKYFTDRDTQTMSRGGVPTGDHATILRLMRTTSYQYFINGQEGMLKFGDAKDLFGIGPKEKGEMVQHRIDEMFAALDRLEVALENGIIEVQGKHLTLQTLNTLRNAARWLQARHHQNFKMLERL